MPSAPPRVTIVVPVFNGAPFLRECLDSLLAQTWPQCEILVMDDASTDATPDIAASYGSATDLSFRQVANRGQFRNVGGWHCASDRTSISPFITLTTSTIQKSSRKKSEFLETHREAGLVFCLSRLMDGTGREYGRLELPRSLRGQVTLSYADVLNGVLTYKNVFMPTPSAMARAGGVPRWLARSVSSSGAPPISTCGFAAPESAGSDCSSATCSSYRHTSTSEGQSYQLRRTEPENFFAVMDHEIAELWRIGGDAATWPVEPSNPIARWTSCARASMRISRETWRPRRPHGARCRYGPCWLVGRIRRPRHLSAVGRRLGCSAICRDSRGCAIDARLASYVRHVGCRACANVQ